MLRRLFVLGTTGLLVGCGVHLRPDAPPAPAPLPVRAFHGLDASRVQLTLDPTLTAIASAESEFAKGEAELRVGHQTAARERFDAAIDTLLAVPGGARSDPRLQAEFDTLLDRIGAHESLELRAGDGFAEAGSEPAAIDDLLAYGSAERATVPAPTTAELVAADLARTPHDIPIQINDRVLSYVELFQGQSAVLRRGRPRARCAVPADDPGRLPRRRAAARPGLRAAHRERVQAHRAVEGERQGHVAVRGGNRKGGRTRADLVPRRARRPGEGDARRRAVSEDAARHVQRRLESCARCVQRRHGARAASDEAGARGGLLVAVGQLALSAPRDP